MKKWAAAEMEELEIENTQKAWVGGGYDGATWSDGQITGSELGLPS